MIGLGNLVQDNISGFTGIVTARIEYLNGEISFGVAPKSLTKDGARLSVEWFDATQLEVIN